MVYLVVLDLLYFSIFQFSIFIRRYPFYENLVMVASICQIASKNKCLISLSSSWCVMCISWNTRGLGDSSKSLVVKKLLKSQSADLVLFQETKREDFDILFNESPWSSRDIGWSFVESLGWVIGIMG